MNLRSLVATTLSVAATLAAAPLHAQQARPQLRLAGGVLLQDSPTTTEAGLTLGLSLMGTVRQRLFVRGTLEGSRTAAFSTSDECPIINLSGRCFVRPERETMVALAGDAGVYLVRGRGVRPYVAAGGAVLRSLGPRVAGEEKVLLVPQVTAGVAWGTTRERFVQAAYRRLDRWGDLSARGQATLTGGVALW